MLRKTNAFPSKSHFHPPFNYYLFFFTDHGAAEQVFIFFKLSSESLTFLFSYWNWTKTFINEKKKNVKRPVLELFRLQIRMPHPIYPDGKMCVCVWGGGFSSVLGSFSAQCLTFFFFSQNQKSPSFWLLSVISTNTVRSEAFWEAWGCLCCRTRNRLSTVHVRLVNGSR